ncbi:MAG: hypothetical protein ABI210_01310, partial [Abditibacteriaceae bacterium]
IIEHHQIPHHTLFLWSDNIPWIWHSWLSQVVFYELLAHVSDNIGSLLAMILTALTAIFSLLIWWKVWIRRQIELDAESTPGFLMPLLFLLAIYTAHARFYPRPEIFSAVFLTLLLLLLIRGITSWKSLLYLFVIFALWANFHAGLAVGLVILVISFLCNFVQDRNWKQSRWELLAITAAVAGVFVNPYGWHYWEALKPVASITFKYIDEWKPFWKIPMLETPVIVSSFLCFGVGIIAWVGSGRRRLEHLCWLLAAFALFLIARRNTWLLAEMMIAVVACNPKVFVTANIWISWQKITRRKQQIAERPLKLQAVARWGVCICLFIAVLEAQSDDFWQGQFVNPKVPAQAAQYLKALPTGQHIFNDYEGSSYLEWKLGGKPPLFIDLLNAYHPQIMEDYIKTIDGGDVAAKLLKKWRVNYVVLPQIQDDQYIGRLFIWISIQPKWEIVYNQPDGVIWKYNPNAKPKALLNFQ